MRWPYVSRGRYDDAREQIDALRKQVDALQDQITRIVRREAGMSEVPKPPRPAVEAMPREVHEYIERFGNASIRKEMRDRLYRRHGRGEPWARMLAEIAEEESTNGATP